MQKLTFRLLYSPYTRLGSLINNGITEYVANEQTAFNFKCEKEKNYSFDV